MTDNQGPAEIAVTYLEAWARHDKNAVANLIAEDATFEWPLDRISGAEAFLEAVMGFAEIVTGLVIVAVLDDDGQALIMYEMTTGPFGTLRAAERLEIREGKIQTDTVVLDTYAIRTAEGAESRST